MIYLRPLPSITYDKTGILTPKPIHMNVKQVLGMCGIYTKTLKWKKKDGTKYACFEATEEECRRLDAFLIVLKLPVVSCTW